MKYVSKLIFTILISYFTYIMFTMKPYPWIILDNVNLLIHEAGHLIISFLKNEFLTTLAGSLFQITLPVIFLVYFLIKKELDGIAFCVFWLGDNLINVGIYMKDAVYKMLPLLKEGLKHDWEYIFFEIGQTNNAEKFGDFTINLGYVLLAGSVVLSIVSLFNETLRNLSSKVKNDQS